MVGESKSKQFSSNGDPTSIPTKNNCFYHQSFKTISKQRKPFKICFYLPDSRDSATEGLLSGVGFIELDKASFLLGVDIEL